MTKTQIEIIKQIVDRYIPLGDINSNCHSGICTILDCSRCSDAVKIRNIIKDLEINSIYTQ